jgi:hypothetical protein
MATTNSKESRWRRSPCLVGKRGGFGKERRTTTFSSMPLGARTAKEGEEGASPPGKKWAAAMGKRGGVSFFLC